MKKRTLITILGLLSGQCLFAQSSTSYSHPLTTATENDSSIEHVSSIFNQWGAVYDIRVSGNYAYVATGSSGLHIVDISNPSTPAEVGSLRNIGRVESVSVSGSYACVTLEWRSDGVGVVIADISDPTQPIQVGTFSCPVALRSKCIYRNDIAYFIRNYNRIQLLGLSDPANPVQMGYTPEIGNIQDFALDGDYLYVTEGDYQLRIFGVSNPEQPVQVLSFPLESRAKRIVIHDAVAYLTCDDGLHVIDISDPLHPAQTGYTSGYISDFDVVGGYVYTVNGNSLNVFNVSDPGNIQQGETQNLELNSPHLAISGNLICIADLNHGLTVLQIPQPGYPVVLAQTGSFDGLLKNVAVSKGCLVAPSTSGLYTVDVSDPSNPIVLGKNDQAVDQVAMHNEYAYAVNANGGEFVFNLSDRSNPDLVGSCETTNFLMAITVRDGYSFITNEGGLLVVNTLDPSNPMVTRYTDLCLGNVEDIELSGDYAFVATYVSGLMVIDISNRNLPQRVYFESHSWDQPVASNGLAVYGQYVYLGSIDGIEIYDISDPTNPVYIDRFEAYNSRMTISGHYLFGASRGLGLSVMDISNPVLPELVGYYDTPGSAVDVFVDGGYAYVSDTYSIEIFDCRQLLDWVEPAPASLPQNYGITSLYPNPFNPTLSIVVGLPEAADLNLAVYNLIGQRVAEIHRGRLDGGYRTFSFDGAGLASGVYLVRASVSDKLEQTKRVVLVK